MLSECAMVCNWVKRRHRADFRLNVQHSDGRGGGGEVGVLKRSRARAAKHKASFDIIVLLYVLFNYFDIY